MRKSSLSLITKAALSSKAQQRFWTCRLKDIKAFPVAVEDLENEDPDETTSEQGQQKIPDKVITHLNAEDRARLHLLLPTFTPNALSATSKH
jgi:hypothetical protein